MFSRYRFIITCEHASREIPAAWQELLAPYLASCEEHQIWDPGTAEIGAQLAALLKAPVFYGEHSRLLVDLNRSAHSPTLFSPPIQQLTDHQRTRILTAHYYPFRHQVIRTLDAFAAEEGPIVHLSLHSFTPVFQGETRTADFGLLYDPGSRLEADMANLWLHHLQNARPDLACRTNYPYLGTDDGHVTALRPAFGRHPYLGFELEFNQQLPLVQNAELYANWIHKTLRQTLSHKRFKTLPTAPLPGSAASPDWRVAPSPVAAV